MGIEQKILVTGASLRVCVASALCAVAALTACGQKGALYMPNDPDFQQRAKLPDIVHRQLPGATASPAATPASAATPYTAPNSATPSANAASAATGR
jgi:predicted small lipoprotein YifL